MVRRNRKAKYKRNSDKNIWNFLIYSIHNDFVGRLQTDTILSKKVKLSGVYKELLEAVAQ